MSEGVNNNRGHSDRPGGNDQAGVGEVTLRDGEHGSASPNEPLRARARGTWPARRKVGSKLHMWERLEIVQRMLGSGMAPSTVTLELMRDYGLTRHEADDYQAVVRARWRKNGALEDSEQELQRLKAIAYQAIADASNRKVTVCTGKGDDGEKIYEVVEQPDSKAVLAGVALIARMIGRLEAPQAPQLPPGTTPAVDGAVQVVDRNDLNETLRARRAADTKGNG